MPDQITQIARIGYGKRIKDAIVGMGIGLILFVVSFFVLSWNEQRVDISSVAKTAASVETGQTTGGPVFVSGPLTSDEPLGDGVYLNPGPYLVIQRQVEMYAWVEKKDTETRTDIGGSETRTTTYSYRLEWTKNPEKASSFQEPTGHANPDLKIQSATVRAVGAKVDGYNVTLANLDIPSGAPLAPRPELLTLGDAKIDGAYVFSGSGSLASPQLGDTRTSYRVIAAGTSGTVFGSINGDAIVPFKTAKGDTLFHWRAGDKDAAIATLHGEYVASLWTFRLVGFLLMFVGLLMLLAPIGVVLDVIPVLGSLGKFGIAALALLVTLPLSMLTMLFARLFRNGFIGLAVGIIILIALRFIAKKKKPAEMPAGAAAIPPEVMQYVLDARKAGSDDAAIRTTLISTGWSADVVDKAIGG